MRTVTDIQPHLMMGLAPSEGRDRRIKIHGPEAFEGMRQAGILAAQTLDFITPHVRPGITTGTPQLPRLPKVDLHLGQPRRLPWHPGRAAVDGG